MTLTVPLQTSGRYSVHARHEGHHHGHFVEGESFEDAAVAFVERWSPSIDAQGGVSVLVTDIHGMERCFTVDLEGDHVVPCG